jgi:hypothetical protein
MKRFPLEFSSRSRDRMSVNLQGFAALFKKRNMGFQGYTQPRPGLGYQRAAGDIVPALCG